MVEYETSCHTIGLEAMLISCRIEVQEVTHAVIIDLQGVFLHADLCYLKELYPNRLSNLKQTCI